VRYIRMGKENKDDSEKRSKAAYWNDYYFKEKQSTLHWLPSQFATFCLGEIIEMGISSIVEIAAGNGRDTLFFANNGMKVLATDNSLHSLELLEERVSQHRNIEVSFRDATEKMRDITRRPNESLAFYARFFIHTLTQNELEMFFISVTDAMSTNDKLLLEYRNEEDATKSKVTDAHFRSFYAAEKVSLLATNNNLKLMYEVSGTGLAKWKSDDASVTRQIFSYVGSN